jgi:DNA-binding protein H-NS
MASMDFDNMSFKALLELEAKVQNAIAVARERERAEVKAKLAKLAEGAGFSVKDLFGQGKRRAPSAVKYVNPKDASQTWTGRGRKPNWLVEKLAKGAKIQQFEKSEA